MKIDGPIVLTVLDGWGIAPPSPGNAITSAKTPNLDRFRRDFPYTELQASGPAVGLAEDQDGNSEAGHMNIGAGRVVQQENIRISASINDGTFFRNPAFAAAIHHVQKHDSTLHIMGMFGNSQSAHADPDHLLALLLLAQNSHLSRVRLHLFTDGRDSPRYYAREILTSFLPHLGDARVATIMGRFYAMDRNKNWSRTEMAYRAITEGVAAHRVNDSMEAITQAYNRGESDEFITPTVVGKYDGMGQSDAIIFYNLRSDRARQLTKAFVQKDFEKQNAATKPFVRRRVIAQLTFVAMTDFGPDLDSLLTAFPATLINQTLPMVLHDRRQLYIAESEKYAHVTYFFNGGYADPVGGEDRVMVPSPAVSHYDTTPAMSSREVTDRVCQAVDARRYDFIVVNFANTDMVAHTGNLQAGIAAAEVADDCLGRIAASVLRADGALAITGDHGNLEEVTNIRTGEVDTEHSTNPVPLYLVSNLRPEPKLRPHGVLGDIAPTLLTLMQHPIPPEMTGHSLIDAA